ncbi:hypothetical protein QBC37DRAFT_12160 [Rhypophila decipiens]|uniref:Arylamine N-acetyltransferase n=1 Tax=Rhypophila decipiens TaxID=261697 RepID=A0AAN6Y8R1_9PEZI|nr:hypothetical protein QBC37DRAFT_12160 [Rhypophila decipiens]
MATYTKDQLTQYFQRIRYSPQYDKLSTDPLHFLTELQMYHMAAVPFESLSLHYSKHRIISIDPEDLFQKVVRNGQGGYCMEVNTFFGAVLRSLGFFLIGVGGRVKSPALGYKGWDHMVNLVTINNKRYLVDVGFGADGPLQPVLLEDNHMIPLIGPAQARLQYKSLEEHTDPSQRVWVYSTQETKDAPWTDRYSFVEIEFFPADFEVINLRMSTTPQSFFVQSVMCIRTQLNFEKNGITSVVILFKDTVKKRFRVSESGVESSQTELLAELKTEDDRAKALDKHFGIVLRPEEQRAIRGLASELR